MNRAPARLFACAAALAALTPVLMAASPGEEARLKGSLAITLRGSGAAPFGIASAIFGGTNIGYNLGRLLKAAEKDGLEGLEGLPLRQELPASERYRGTMDFELRPRGRNRWELERLKVRYDFVDRTHLEYDQAFVADNMEASGVVTFADGRWQTSEGWQPEAAPRITLTVFRAESATQCEDPGVSQLLLKAKALVVDTSDWVECYDLEIAARHPMQPTGHSYWRSPMGEVSVEARDGVLAFSGDTGLDLPSSLPLPPDTPEATRENIEAMLKMGQMTQEFLKRGMGEVELDADMTWERRYRGVLADRRVESDRTYVILSGAQARETLMLPLYSVRADPGGPYHVTRGEVLRLDGSKSRGRNLEYEWFFGPHPPAGESGNAGATKKEQRPTAFLLDSMEVILKVTDTEAGVEDVASTTATVTARDWETPLSHRSNWSVTPNRWEAAWGFPVGTALTAEQKRDNPDKAKLCLVSEAYQAGENWCAAPHDRQPGVPQVRVIHPHGWSFDSWSGHGYTLGQVDDPGGPFHEWSYVAEHELSVDREGVFNPTLRPNGPPPPGTEENASRANARLGGDLVAYRASVEKHEGMGSGAPYSGHSLILRQVLDQTDPAREIEKLYAKTESDVKGEADRLLNELDQRMADESAKLDDDESNQTNWEGSYYVYDRQKDEWCLTKEHKT